MKPDPFHPFSFEVDADDVVDGMASSLSGHPARDLAKCHAAERKEFLAALERLRTAPLHVFDDRLLAGIAARSKAIHSLGNLDLVAVDYLGLINDCWPLRGETKAQAVGRVTGGLKRLAMELDIVVILLAQLNRGAVNDGDREPRLSDLRDSGDIEQDADRVLAIHRPDQCPILGMHQSQLDRPEERPRFGVSLLQLKGRNVGTGGAHLWFNRRLARFELPSADPPRKAKQ